MIDLQERKDSIKNTKKRYYRFSEILDFSINISKITQCKDKLMLGYISVKSKEIRIILDKCYQKDNIK
jgi:hypothetical protein